MQAANANVAKPFCRTKSPPQASCPSVHPAAAPACNQDKKAYIATALALLLRLAVNLPQPTFAFLESRNSELGLVAMSRMRLTSAMFRMPICFR